MIVLGAPAWVWPAAALGVLALALVARAYRGMGVRARASRAAMAFKVLGFALLVLSLVEPMTRRVQARPGANQLHVLVDDSASLTVGDRAAEVRALLAEDAPWLERVGQDFDVRQHAFDRRVRALVGDLAFEGTSSDLGAGLAHLAERAHGRPVAGTVVLTDGLATDGLDPAVDLGALGPVYPVVVGDAVVRDLALGPVEATVTNFEQAPVTLAVDLTSVGCDGARVEVELFDREGQRLARERVEADDGAPVEVRFDAPPERAGLQAYRVAARLVEEREEATAANNERWVVVDRGAGPYRVLYVSGRPNWEFKFLSRAAAEDDELELVGLLRIARRQPKFTFRDSGDPVVCPHCGWREDSPHEDAAPEQPECFCYEERLFADLKEKGL